MYPVVHSCDVSGPWSYGGGRQWHITAHRIMHTTHRTMYSYNCTLYNEYCTLNMHTAQLTLKTVHSIVHFTIKQAVDNHKQVEYNYDFNLKSCIRETPNLLTDANSSTNIFFPLASTKGLILLLLLLLFLLSYC